MHAWFLPCSNIGFPASNSHLHLENSIFDLHFCESRRQSFLFKMRAMRIPLHRLWLLPLVSGVVWFVTLLSLLLRWVARGTPRYPGQSNPYVAFISDIAAFDMKPLFLIGACITAVAFIGTVCAVHFARYDDRMYGINDFWYKKWSSVLAMVSGVVAGLGLILLAIMDTFRFHEEHHVLLLVCFS